MGPRAAHLPMHPDTAQLQRSALDSSLYRDQFARDQVCVCLLSCEPHFYLVQGTEVTGAFPVG